MLAHKFIAKTRRMKGFIITFQWVNGEPAMCILCEHHMRRGAWVICLSSAFKYADESWLIPCSAVIANHFGMQNDRYAARAICDVILNNIEELVRFQPEPDEVRIAREGPPPQVTFDANNHRITIH